MTSKGETLKVFWKTCRETVQANSPEALYIHIVCKAETSAQNQALPCKVARKKSLCKSGTRLEKHAPIPPARSVRQDLRKAQAGPASAQTGSSFPWPRGFVCTCQMQRNRCKSSKVPKGQGHLQLSPFEPHAHHVVPGGQPGPWTCQRAFLKGTLTLMPSEEALLWQSVRHL